MFNAIKYSQELERVGFSREQAETSVRLLIDVMNENLATKSDLREMESNLRLDIQNVRSEVKELEYRMTIRLGTIVTVAIGATATLLKLLGH